MSVDKIYVEFEDMALIAQEERSHRYAGEKDGIHLRVMCEGNPLLLSARALDTGEGHER